MSSSRGYGVAASVHQGVVDGNGVDRLEVQIFSCCFGNGTGIEALSLELDEHGVDEPDDEVNHLGGGPDKLRPAVEGHSLVFDGDVEQASAGENPVRIADFEYIQQEEEMFQRRKRESGWSLGAGERP